MVTVLAEVEERIAALPPEEWAPRRELLWRVTDLVVEAPLEELAALVDELVESSAQRHEARAWSVAEAQKRNLERLLEDQARLVRESITAARVWEGMNISRQRLHQLSTQGRLVAIQFQDGAPSLYPFWQFTRELPIKPVPGLPQLIETAQQAGMDMVMLHFFMVEPNDRLGGRAPHELVAEGDLDSVLGVLSSVGLGAF